MHNVTTPMAATLVPVSLVSPEMESIASMSMNVTAIHVTPMQAVITPVAALNVIVNKVIKVMVMLALMLMNASVTIPAIKMPGVKILLDHTHVNVLLDLLVMAIHVSILTNVRPRATRVVEIKTVPILLAHSTASVKPDILLKMKNVSTSMNVKIKHAI